MFVNLRGVFAAGLLVSAAAHAGDFKGLSFGAPVDAARTMFPAATCHASFAGRSTCTFVNRARDSTSPITYGAQPVSLLLLRFIDDRFVGADVEFSPSGFDLLRVALEAKFGAPASTEAVEVKTPAGAAYTNTVVLWQLPNGGSIRLSRYGTSITAGLASLRSAIGLADDKAREAQLLERAKADV